MSGSLYSCPHFATLLRSALLSILWVLKIVHVIIAGQIFGIAFSAATLMLIKYGFGCHAWDVPFTVFNNHLMKTWDRTITYGSCIEVRKIWLFVAVMNVMTDIFILFLPIFTLWHVRMPRRQKIGVIAILMVGILTVEIYVGLICGSLPQAKPFLRHHFPKLLGSSKYGVSTYGALANTNTCGSRTDVPNEFAVGNRKDVLLHVLVTAGKSASVEDADNQRGILGNVGILVRSEIYTKEEFNHDRRDAP
ncbi:hypothetical protein B0O99DRAFT_724715 [Bisporella sp. PMI_857]|nr:hypothetical protein B0O99DRAFT_728792 [Bisporella sp. PMI_857]KAH8600614.1 hypothetical protein B0O99DRAFT_724715 [Bisporella sp. PMI_857]